MVVPANNRRAWITGFNTVERPQSTPHTTTARRLTLCHLVVISLKNSGYHERSRLATPSCDHSRDNLLLECDEWSVGGRRSLVDHTVTRLQSGFHPTMIAFIKPAPGQTDITTTMCCLLRRRA